MNEVAKKSTRNLPKRVGSANTFSLCENENLLSHVHFEHISSTHKDKFCSSDICCLASKPLFTHAIRWEWESIAIEPTEAFVDGVFEGVLVVDVVRNRYGLTAIKSILAKVILISMLSRSAVEFS